MFNAFGVIVEDSILTQGAPFGMLRATLGCGV
jgi:hypothetical protein